MGAERFQEKHIFKFNLRCLSSSSLPSFPSSAPNCWQGPVFFLSLSPFFLKGQGIWKLRPTLKKLSITGLFGNVATAPVREAQVPAIGERVSEPRVQQWKEISAARAYFLHCSLKRKGVYHWNMRISIAGVSVLYYSISNFLSFFHINIRHTLLSGQKRPSGVRGI